MTDLLKSVETRQEFDFQPLVELCRATHGETQIRASRVVNSVLVVRNWLFGCYIIEFEQNGTDYATYGKQTLKRLSHELKGTLGRGFSVDSLELMRRFYLGYSDKVGSQKSETLSRIFGPENSDTVSRIFVVDSNPLLPKEIRQTLSGELLGQFPLAWSHYVTLLTIDDSDERSFYEIEANQNGWSVRELERQVASSLYQRLALSRDKDEIRRLAAEGQVIEKAADLIKSPFVLEFLGLEEKPTYSEDDLESAIINKLESFLLELGKGFLFEARQRRFTFDNDHYYVDLVFYNRLLRCYVLIDLKLDKLTHEDLGQMQMYVNYFDRYEKLDEETPTIGIVLCARKNDALVELTLPENANIFASKYELYLPSKEELKQQLARICEELRIESGS
jgi:predicted nuclease of restriction endonuclease-like (RecB) superfamily